MRALGKTPRSLQLTVRLIALLVVSWCVMTLAHEAGHLVGGWLGGGTLHSADLWPWHLPYSIFDPDPQPLVTLWSGPLLGVLAPLAVAACAGRSWVWFVADFCLLANGVYLALGWFSADRFLDTARLLESGASPAVVALYCAATLGTGYSRFRRDLIGLLTRS